MIEDAELLRRYARERSEAAFAELIQRQVHLVYWAAWRMVGGDPHRAEDVTQQVFAELAAQAHRLSRHPALAGWLYTTTRWLALRTMRTEQRRQHREEEATRMNQLLHESGHDPEWERLGPVLEDAMHELGDKDRLALLLRFFQNKALKDVGTALGLSENSARMRVERALEKLRVQLERRGVTSTSGALALALAGNAATAAPAGFVATLTAASVAGTAAGAGSTVTALKVMTITKFQASLAGLAALLIVIVPLTWPREDPGKLVAENQRQSTQLEKLAAENLRLSNALVQARHQVAVAESTAPTPAVVGGTPRGNHTAASLMAVATNGLIKLSSAQVESYLKDQKRSAGSLLAAFRATGDKSLLKEALEKYPNNPQVAYAETVNSDATPEEKRQWLDNFKQSAPGNALANYLSAFDYIKNGQAAQAVQEMSSAAGKTQFEDYTQNFVQDGQEVYLAAGYNSAEAEMLSTTQLLLPQLTQLKQLNQEMVNAANAYTQAGDTASAQALLQMDMQLGQRFNGAPGEAVISTLVGIAIQKNALQDMDPNAPYGPAGQTVTDALNQLNQQREAMRVLVQQVEPIVPEMSDEDYISYKNRWMVFGEQNAMQWAAGKYGKQ